MRIHDLSTAEGASRAFEVSNLLLSRARACKIVETIPGAIITKRSRLFRDNDEFCAFKIGLDEFVIEEPFGDNSRYWVGTKDAGRSESLSLIRRAFEEHKAWVSLLRAFAVCGAVLLAGFVYLKASSYIAQDKCLDAGGRWEGKADACSYTSR